MATLTLTASSQVTFRKEVLQHLGIGPGDTVEINLLPGGHADIKAARPSGEIESFFGVLAGKTTKIATLEEIDDAIADGWAGRVSLEDHG